VSFACVAAIEPPLRGTRAQTYVHAGGYWFGDFLRFGAPLNLLMAAIALLVIPRVWPLV